VAKPPIRGRLVAVDGAHGTDVFESATALVEMLADRGMSAGISRWDASGLFTDVVAAPAIERDLSPRTLLLLYAADLAFRLRWEIGPALDQGYIVIAAPYTSTALAFGTAAGLSREWLTTLLRFAPAATRTVILKDANENRVWKRRPERGFGECCTTLLEATPEGFARRKTRNAMLGALSTDAEAHGGLYRRKHLRAIIDEILTPSRRKPARRRHAAASPGSDDVAPPRALNSR
jgi:thymidylate kinase